jgi:uncharacterized RDD family membrane protein YckC
MGLFCSCQGNMRYAHFLHCFYYWYNLLVGYVGVISTYRHVGFVLEPWKLRWGQGFSKSIYNLHVLAQNGNQLLWVLCVHAILGWQQDR